MVYGHHGKRQLAHQLVHPWYDHIDVAATGAADHLDIVQGDRQVDVFPLVIFPPDTGACSGCTLVSLYFTSKTFGSCWCHPFHNVGYTKSQRAAITAGPEGVGGISRRNTKKEKQYKRNRSPSLSLRIMGQHSGERPTGRGFQRGGAYSLKGLICAVAIEFKEAVQSLLSGIHFSEGPL